MALRRGEKAYANFYVSEGLLAEVPACRCLWNRSSAGQAKEEELERCADALLRATPSNHTCPVYTERQMARHGEGKRLWLSDDFLENVATVQTGQEFLDELKFLMSLTDLQPMERLILNVWMEGYAQEEIAQLTNIPQQKISRLLRSTLECCYDTWAVAFSQFSRHTIYRKPAHRHLEWHGLICPNCGDWFPWGLGAGRYCSERCRATTRR